MRHPVVGDLELHYEKFAVAGADGQLLVVYHAAPDSPSAEALAKLDVASWSSDDCRPRAVGSVNQRYAM